MADKTLEDICGDMADAPKIRLSTKKMLKGHINKVNSVHYSGDSRYVICESYADSSLYNCRFNFKSQSCFQSLNQAMKTLLTTVYHI